MKAWKWGVIAVGVALLGVGFAYRTTVRDAWARRNAPALPKAEKFVPPSSTVTLSGADTSLVEGGAATSEHFALISSPPTAPAPLDPFSNAKPLSSEINLDVPFTSQAPEKNWDYPYQEACEEASAIMVDAFYRNISGVIPPTQATKAIDALVKYENDTLGYYKDTTAAETANVIKSYFKYSNVLVKPIRSAEDIKRVVANGFPVIVPAAGKLLPNPNFRNGGPLYHMLVVKGYIGNTFITNDPGTRLGANFTYTQSALINAIHDWNGGDVLNGEKVMLIVLPNQK